MHYIFSKQPFVCDFDYYIKMMIKKIVLTVFILSSSLLLLSCTKTDDKDLLNQQLDKLLEVIEDKDAKKIRQYLAKDFLVSEKMNNEKFFLFVHYQFRRNKNISVTVLNREIRLHGSSIDNTTADVIMDTLLLGSGDWLPERGQAYNVESRWIKEGGNWVMSRLRWSKK